jgi:hypothetical protein
VQASTVSLDTGGDLQILCRTHKIEGRTVAFLELVARTAGLTGDRVRRRPPMPLIASRRLTPLRARTGQFPVSPLRPQTG